MSRSNNTELLNPASRFYSWNGESGGFRYFDKTKGEKGERVDVPLPFRFMVLDCLSTIRGYNDDRKSGYWSNEVRDIKRDVLTVKTKGGMVAKGVYGEVMKSKGTTGAKYCQSVYIAIKEGGELVISNLQLTGAALSSWIEFRKKDRKIYDGAIEVATMVEGKKGKTVYQSPVFRKIAASEESEGQAKLLDGQLQEYLGLYFKRTQDAVAQMHEEEVPVHGDEDAPVESYEATGEKLDPSEPIGTWDDDPF